MTYNKIWVVIPFYLDDKALLKSVDALNRGTYKNFEIYIRDNSNDNIFFTAAINQGIRAGLADPQVSDFLVLNQDCFLEQDALAALKAHLDQFSLCGIACPLQIDDQRQVTWGGSLDAFPAGKHYILPIDSFEEPFETYWANGACMLIRRAAVEEIGLLDKNMRFICSDSDYSFTARARGWEVHVVPAARAEHALNSSAKNTSEELTRIKMKDVLYFYDKWISGGLYSSISLEGQGLDLKTIKIRMNAVRENLKRSGG